MAAILFFIVMVIFAGFSYVVLTKTQNRGIIITYAVMLFLSMVVFGGLAVMSSVVKGSGMFYFLILFHIRQG